MSLENAEKFLEKMKSDAKFKADMQKRLSESKLTVLKKAGFDCTEDELRRASEAAGLTAEELSSVQGGGHGGPGRICGRIY